MVQKSKGPRRRTRKLLRRKIKEKTPITKYLQEFKKGEKVVIDPNPSNHKGRPFRRFFGKIGIVKGKRGKAYLIKIKNGKKEKLIIAKPQHLKAV